jgi:RNA polymerase sigma-70 factor (ECF subfamily)
MSDSFAEFLRRLRARDNPAAQELFGRFPHQLYALALRHIEGGLRHKADPEDVVQSACKSFFVRCDDGKPELIN